MYKKLSKIFNLKYLLVILLLQSCGRDYYHNVTIPPEIVQKTQELEGYYYFELGGELEIKVNAQGLVSLTTLQELSTVNSNNTYAYLPKISLNNKLIASDNKIRFSVNADYTSNNDVEEDDNNSNITGKHRTDFIIYKKDNKLLVEFKIFDGELKDNPNGIIVDRTLTGF